MRMKKILSAALAFCLLVSLVPGGTLTVRAANADPEYERVLPELIIFNARTGASTDYFKSVMKDHFYNAAAAGYFKKVGDSSSLLNYEVKVGSNSTYVWSDFKNTELAYLSDQYGQLKAGYAVTLNTNSHSHSWGFAGWYSVKLMSYMNAALYCDSSDGSQYSNVVTQVGQSTTSSSSRKGNASFSSLPYVINGANSQYGTVNGQDVSSIDRDMYLQFVNSVIKYDGEDRTCNCGGSAEGHVVSFYDPVAPSVSSVSVLQGNEPCTNFKAGDTVKIVLNCSEPVRFADDNAEGKGDVYIGLMVEGMAERLYAHLTGLKNNGLNNTDSANTLTFEYSIPAGETGLFTVLGIDMTAAPAGGTALIHKDADIDLVQAFHHEEKDKTYNAVKPTSVSDDLGYTKTTSYVTDLAGNALVNRIDSTAPVSFYIDCESPFVAKAAVSAVTNNNNVKAALGKTGMAPNTDNYEDNSDLYLGTGDSFSLTLYMNEVVGGGSALVTTNVRSGSGYLTLTADTLGSTAASGIGSQYGRGASKGVVSVFYTSSVSIGEGMSIDGTEGLKISSVSFTGAYDASGNSAANGSVSPDKQYRIDTDGPVPQTSAAVQNGGINHSFYLPFKVTDAASGVSELPASLVVLDPQGRTSAFEYAVTTEASAPSKWTAGSFGSTIDFTQTGTDQYLHIRPVEGEIYDLNGNASVVFTLADYAGNVSTVSKLLEGVVLDGVAPVVKAGGSVRTYDNSTHKGTLTVEFTAEDRGGLAEVQYAWTLSTGSAISWKNVTGSFEGDAFADLSVEETVSSGGSFSGTLWVRAEDIAGHETEFCLGEYSYDLSGISYALDYTTAITAAPAVKISSLQSGGRLVFDLHKKGDDVHYLRWFDDSTAENIFARSGSWYKAETADGLTFTDLENAGSITGGYLDGYAGEVMVKVYSGTSVTIPTLAETLSDGVVITNAAGTGSFTLRVVPDGDTEAISCEFSNISERLYNYFNSTPWLKDGVPVNSTLEGIELTFELSDANGWDFEDVDWENSYLYVEGSRICAIGSGPRQTITLPAADYPTGINITSMGLKLARRSSASTYSFPIPLGDNGRIMIDGSEPGSIAPTLLRYTHYVNCRENTYPEGHSMYPGTYWSVEESEAFPPEEIAFDQDAVIYIPASDGIADLMVQAFDPDGSPYENFTSTIGQFDIVAWNTDYPDTVVSLDYMKRCFEKNADGSFSAVPWYKATASGRRCLSFAVDGAEKVDTNGKGSFVSVVSDKDNIIAVQARYSNGKVSDIVYLTVHPVTLDISGSFTTEPAFDGTYGMLITGPGEAVVRFTPVAGTNTSGVRLYCAAGSANRSYSGGQSFISYKDISDVKEMTLQGDGSYTLKLDDVSDVNAENIRRVAFARDSSGNLVKVGYTGFGFASDNAAPAAEGSITTGSGSYTAVFTIRDDSLLSCSDAGGSTEPLSRPVTVDLSYDSSYGDLIGAFGEALSLTVDASSGEYVWTADVPNKLGIYEVRAELTLENSGSNPYLYLRNDAYLTLTVKGAVSPEADGADMTLELTASDAFGNTMALPAQVSAQVSGSGAEVINAVYKETGEHSDRALYLTFSAAVKPVESWINRSIDTYATEWHDAFPIWKDGSWEIRYTDIFGRSYAKTIELVDVFGEYGFDLDISTLENTTEPVIISAFEDDKDPIAVRKAGDYEGYATSGEELEATENGEYKVIRFPSDLDYNWCYVYSEVRRNTADILTIYLNNIVTGDPEVSLYFFVDEFKEQYLAGSDEQFRGDTKGSVTVTYKTDRDTSPIGDSSVTLRAGNDEFSFKYRDTATGIDHEISGKLSKYGINLMAPDEPYKDNEAPVIDIINVWAQKGSGFVQAEAFPGSASEEEIADAIAGCGSVQSYDLVVSATDASRWKLLVKSEKPETVSFEDSESDQIRGVDVSGNNVLITNKAESDFWLVVTDAASVDGGALKDNFICIRIPVGSCSFDTVPPHIIYTVETTSLYKKTVYLTASDTDDSDNDTSAGVVITGKDVIAEVNVIDEVVYGYKLVMTDNDTVVKVTATDAAGNFSVEDIQVSGIDVSAPELSVSWSPCFKDPVSGKLDTANPTAGPVNVDVVAHITSDKEIAKVLATYEFSDSDGYSYTMDCDLNGEDDWWGRVDYTSQRISVHFSDTYVIWTGEQSPITVHLTVEAPNGRSKTTAVSLGAGVIDKVVPFQYYDPYDPIGYVTVNEHKREGFDTPYAVTLEISDPDESVYCMDAGTPGKAYSADDPFILELDDNEEHSFLFADKAGNLSRILIPALAPDELDSVVPVLEISGLEDSDSATSSDVVFDISVTEENEVKLSASSPNVSFGSLTSGFDEEGNRVWTGTVTVSKNGTYRITAEDIAGNSASASVTVNNIDKIMPIISFDTSTVALRQDSAAAELEALLSVNSGVYVWDNEGIKAGSLSYDAQEVLLSRPGIYAVTYSAEDNAGNRGEAIRYVKVIDKNLPVITVDGALTEYNGTITVRKGDHKLAVSGLSESGEPYKIQLVKGLWSAGQMKRASAGIQIHEDLSFSLGAPGFYTLYLTTQSRQTFRTLLYVEE